MRRPDESMLTPTRLLVALGIAGFYAVMGWGYSHTRTRILLTAQRVVIGAGSRGAKRINFNPSQTVTVEKREPFLVLEVTEKTGEQEHIYLNPPQEGEITATLIKSGHLKEKAEPPESPDLRY